MKTTNCISILFLMVAPLQFAISQNACRPLSSNVKDLKIQCILSGDIVDCSTAAATIGTIAAYSCQESSSSRSTEGNRPRYMICQQNGVWSEESLFRSFTCLSRMDSNEGNLNGNCGIIPHARSSPLIIGGDLVNPKDWPWHAVIFKNGIFQCGGTLISPSVVLTAGGCVTYTNTRSVLETTSFQITLGSLSSNFELPGRNSQAFNVERVVLHPNYQTYPSPSGDIALIFLDRAAYINDFVLPVCLPIGTSPLNQNWVLGDVVGFGQIDPTRPSKSGGLRHVSLPIIPSQNCFIRGETSISKFCAGYDSQQQQQRQVKSICFGDSGGGFFVKGKTVVGPRFVVEGIASYFPTFSLCQTFGRFTNVRYFMPWIRYELNRDDSPIVHDM